MKIVGHRGARGLAPENTLVSIAKALEYSVDEIEVDARVTRDNVVVLCHDSSLLRISGTPKRIADHTFSELKAVNMDICTLDEAIQLINMQAVLNIEVKQREPAAPIAQVIRTYLDNGWSEDDFVIGSKSQTTLKALHQELPLIQKVVIARFLSIWAIHRARQVGARRLTMNQYFVWFGFIKAISRHHELFVYTLNNPGKAKKWEKYGLAGCVTDRPDLYKRQRDIER